MPTFMCFLNWTDQGAKAVKDAVARYEATNALIAGLGGRLVCGYVTTGQYDVVLVVEMPNGDAMTKLAVALTSRGNVRTTTARAFSPEEFESSPPRHLDRPLVFSRAQSRAAVQPMRGLTAQAPAPAPRCAARLLAGRGQGPRVARPSRASRRSR